MPTKKFKEKDRVVRVTQPAPQGVVKEIRTEMENSGLSADARDRAAMIGVVWDNGTFSYSSPDALQLVDE